MATYVKTEPTITLYTKKGTYTSTATDACATQTGGIIPGAIAYSYTPSIRTGSTNPGYKTRIKNLQDASSGYNVTTISVSPAEGYISRKSLLLYWCPLLKAWKSRDYAASGYESRFDSSPLGIPSGLDTTVYNNAVGAFAENTFNTLHPFLGGVFAGELGETLDLAGHALNALVDHNLNHLSKVSKTLKGLKTIRKRGPQKTKTQKAKEVFKAISEDYLTYAFGAMPLFNDVKAADEAIRRVNKTEVVHIHARKSDSYATSSIVNSPSGGESYLNAASLTMTTVKTKQVSYTVRQSGAVVRFSSATHERLPEFGIDLQSFVPTVWNLIPYSFMVDYISNASAVMTAATLFNTRWLYHNIATKYTWENTSTITRVSMNGFSLDYSISPARWRKNVYSRVSGVLDGVEIPNFSLNLPDLRSVVNTTALGLAHLNVSQQARNLL